MAEQNLEQGSIDFPEGMPADLAARALELGVSDFAIGAFTNAQRFGLDTTDPRVMSDIYGVMERAYRSIQS